MPQQKTEHATYRSSDHRRPARLLLNSRRTDRAILYSSRLSSILKSQYSVAHDGPMFTGG